MLPPLNSPCCRKQLAEPLFGRMKRIHVYQNGEPKCYIVNIVPRDFRSWNSVLQHLTNVIKPSFGPVKKLLALKACRFVESFEELDACEKYIALGLNGTLKMIPGGYREVSRRQKTHCRQLYCGQHDSEMPCFLKETKKRGLTIIYAVRNRIIVQVPKKIVLRKDDLDNWDLILRFLSKKLDIPEGAACVCTIFGEMLCDPRQLQHGFLYVVVPYQEDFVQMDYLKCFQNLCYLYRRNYVLDIRPASYCRRNKNKSKHRKRNDTSCSCGAKSDTRKSTPASISYTSRSPEQFSNQGMFRQCRCNYPNTRANENSGGCHCCKMLNRKRQSSIVVEVNESSGSSSMDGKRKVCRCKDCPAKKNSSKKPVVCKKIVQEVTYDLRIDDEPEPSSSEIMVEGCFYKQMSGNSRSNSICCPKQPFVPNSYHTRPLSCSQSTESEKPQEYNKTRCSCLMDMLKEYDQIFVENPQSGVTECPFKRRNHSKTVSSSKRPSEVSVKDTKSISCPNLKKINIGKCWKCKKSSG